MSDPVSTKYKVPDNLRPLLEAFARETLITQPPGMFYNWYLKESSDLIEFGLTFFETLHKFERLSNE